MAEAAILPTPLATAFVAKARRVTFPSWMAPPGGSRVTSDRAFACPAPKFVAFAVPMSEPIVTASVSALATWTFTSSEATALPAPLSRGAGAAPYGVHRDSAGRCVQREIGDRLSVAGTARAIDRVGPDEDAAGDRDGGLGDLAFGRGEGAVARAIHGEGRGVTGASSERLISAPALNTACAVTAPLPSLPLSATSEIVTSCSASVSTPAKLKRACALTWPLPVLLAPPKTLMSPATWTFAPFPPKVSSASPDAPYCQRRGRQG